MNSTGDTVRSYIIKYTYSAGPTWTYTSVGNIVNATNIEKGKTDVGTSGHLLHAYGTKAVGALEVMRSTNANDPVTFDAPVTIRATGILSNSMFGLMYMGGTTWRIYYISTHDRAAGDIYYKETTDEVNWGTECRLYITSNTWLGLTVCRRWWNASTPPFDIYDLYYGYGTSIFQDSNPNIITTDGVKVSDSSRTNPELVLDSVKLSDDPMMMMVPISTSPDIIQYPFQERLFCTSGGLWVLVFYDPANTSMKVAVFNSARTSCVVSTFLTSITGPDTFACIIDGSNIINIVYSLSGSFRYYWFQVSSFGPITPAGDLWAEIDATTHLRPSISLNSSGYPIATGIKEVSTPTGGTDTYGAAGVGTTQNWTNPSRAYGTAIDASYATCAPARNTTVVGRWKTYGITGSDTIDAVYICPYWKVSTKNSNATLRIRVSWDGGTSWSSYYDDTTEPLTAAETTVDVTAATAWTWSKLSDANLQVEVDGKRGTSTTAVTFSLDRIVVKVEHSGTTTTYTPYVYEANTQYPTYSWSNNTGFPLQLDATDDSTWSAKPLGASADKVAVVYSRSSQPPKIVTFDGASTWAAAVAASGNIYAGAAFDAVIHTDDVLLVWAMSGYNIRANLFTYSSQLWDVATDIASSLGAIAYPSLSANGANDICFYESGDHLYYVKRTSGTWDVSPTDWSDESTLTLPSPCYIQSLQAKNASNIIGVAYTAKTSSPYEVHFKDYSDVVIYTITETVLLADAIYNSLRTYIVTENPKVADVLRNNKTTTLADAVKLTDLIFKNPQLILTETIRLSEALARSVSYILQESVKLSDVPRKSGTSVITDAVKLTDAPFKSGTSVITENPKLTDALARNKTSIPITESIKLTDLLYRNKAIILTENPKVIDSMLLTKSTSLSDAVKLADLTLLTKITSVSDAIKLVESQILTKSLVQSETFHLSDLIYRNKTYMSVAETILLTEQLFRSKQFTIADQVNVLDVIMRDKLLALADSVTLSEYVLRGGPSILAETVLLSDAIVRNKSLPITESVKLTEALAMTKTFSLQDSVNLVDILLRNKTATFVTDAVKLADGASLPSKLAILAETVTLSEIVRANKAFVLSEIAYVSDLIKTGKITTLADTVLLLDDLLVGKSMTTISDNVKLLDAILNNKVFAETETVKLLDSLLTTKSDILAESVRVSDDVLRHKRTVVADTITLLDNLFAGAFKSVDDVVTLVDAITADEYLLITDSAKLSDLAILNRSFSLADQILLSDQLYAHKYLFQTENVILTEEVIKEELVILKTVLDSLMVTDSVYAHKIHSLTEDVVLTEAFVRDVRTTVADYIYANDLLNVNKSLVTVGDVVNLLDSVYANKGLQLLETILSVDAAYLDANLNVVDFIGLSDTLTVDKAFVLSELARLTDDIRIEKALLLQEVIIVLDAIERYIGGLITVEDAVKLFDDLITTKTMLLQDTTTVTDVVLKHLSAMLFENIYLADAPVIDKPSMTVSDYATLFDAILLSKGVISSDYIAVIDQLLTDRGMTISELVSLTDERFVDKAFVLSDTITLVDLVNAYISFLITEAIRVFDDVLLEKNITVDEVIKLVDALMTGRTITVAESVKLVDEVLTDKLIIVIDKLCDGAAKTRKIGRWPTAYHDDNTTKNFGNKVK
jgi:hypothetical protein